MISQKPPKLQKVETDERGQITALLLGNDKYFPGH